MINKQLVVTTIQPPHIYQYTFAILNFIKLQARESGSVLFTITLNLLSHVALISYTSYVTLPIFLQRKNDEISFFFIKKNKEKTGRGGTDFFCINIFYCLFTTWEKKILNSNGILID